MTTIETEQEPKGASESIQESDDIQIDIGKLASSKAAGEALQLLSGLFKSVQSAIPGLPELVLVTPASSTTAKQEQSTDQVSLAGRSDRTAEQAPQPRIAAQRFNLPDGTWRDVHFDPAGNIARIDEQNGLSLISIDGGKTFKLSNAEQVISGKLSVGKDGSYTIRAGDNSSITRTVDGKFEVRDSKNRLVNTTLDNGAQIWYDKQGNIAEILDAYGQSCKLVHDQKGLASITYPDGMKWMRTPDGSWMKQGSTETWKGQISVDKNGVITEKWSDKNDTTVIRRPDGWSETKNNNGQCFHRQNSDGSKIFLSAKGDVTATTDAKGLKRSFDWKDGRITQFTDESGTWTTEDGKTWKKRGSSETRRHELTLAPDGSLRVKDLNTGQTTANLMDGGKIVTNSKGQIIEIVDRNGQTKSFGYDEKGLLNSMRDSTGDWRRTGKDTWEQRPSGKQWSGTAFVDGDGTVTTQTKNGNRVQQKTSGEYIWSTTYPPSVCVWNHKGQVVETIDPHGHRREYGYNGNNQLNRFVETETSGKRTEWFSSNGGYCWLTPEGEQVQEYLRVDVNTGTLLRTNSSGQLRYESFQHSQATQAAVDSTDKLSANAQRFNELAGDDPLALEQFQQTEQRLAKLERAKTIEEKDRIFAELAKDGWSQLYDRQIKDAVTDRLNSGNLSLEQMDKLLSMVDTGIAPPLAVQLRRLGVHPESSDQELKDLSDALEKRHGKQEIQRLLANIVGYNSCTDELRAQLSEGKTQSIDIAKTVDQLSIGALPKEQQFLAHFDKSLNQLLKTTATDHQNMQEQEQRFSVWLNRVFGDLLNNSRTKSGGYVRDPRKLEYCGGMDTSDSKRKRAQRCHVDQVKDAQEKLELCQQYSAESSKQYQAVLSASLARQHYLLTAEGKQKQADVIATMSGGYLSPEFKPKYLTEQAAKAHSRLFPQSRFIGAAPKDTREAINSLADLRRSEFAFQRSVATQLSTADQRIDFLALAAQGLPASRVDAEVCDARRQQCIAKILEDGLKPAAGTSISEALRSLEGASRFAPLFEIFRACKSSEHSITSDKLDDFMKSKCTELRNYLNNPPSPEALNQITQLISSLKEAAAVSDPYAARDLTAYAKSLQGYIDLWTNKDGVKTNLEEFCKHVIEKGALESKSLFEKLAAAAIDVVVAVGALALLPVGGFAALAVVPMVFAGAREVSGEVNRLLTLRSEGGPVGEWVAGRTIFDPKTGHFRSFTAEDMGKQLLENAGNDYIFMGIGKVASWYGTGIGRGSFRSKAAEQPLAKAESVSRTWRNEFTRNIKPASFDVAVMTFSHELVEENSAAFGIAAVLIGGRSYMHGRHQRRKVDPEKASSYAAQAKPDSSKPLEFKPSSAQAEPKPLGTPEIPSVPAQPKPAVKQAEPPRGTETKIVAESMIRPDVNELPPIPEKGGKRLWNQSQIDQFFQTMGGKTPENTQVLAGLIRQGAPGDLVTKLGKIARPALLELLKGRESLNDLLKEGKAPENLSPEQWATVRDSIDALFKGDGAKDVVHYGLHVQQANAILKAAMELAHTAEGKARARALCDLAGSVGKLPRGFEIPERVITGNMPPENLQRLAQLIKGAENLMAPKGPDQAGWDIAKKMVEALRTDPDLADWVYVPTNKSPADQIGIDGVFFNVRTGDMRPIDFKVQQGAKPGDSQPIDPTNPFRFRPNFPGENMVQVTRDFLALPRDRHAIPKELAEAIFGREHTGLPDFRPENISAVDFLNNASRAREYMCKLQDYYKSCTRDGIEPPSVVKTLTMKAEAAYGWLEGRAQVVRALPELIRPGLANESHLRVQQEGKQKYIEMPFKENFSTHVSHDRLLADMPKRDTYSAVRLYEDGRIVAVRENGKTTELGHVGDCFQAARNHAQAEMAGQPSKLKERLGQLEQQAAQIQVLLRRLRGDQTSS